ncbi:MAG: ATP-binding protein [Ilumatobacteraceae bacterium]|nr:ATP-binding protein [Ilumatobacteraceae bacterium]
MSETSRDPAAVLQREYEGELATLRAARRDVVEWLTELGADDETKGRAALVVSELTSNAIQSAPGRTYNLQVARLDDGSAAISVRNHPIGSRPPARELWRPPPESPLRKLLPRGRGLAIVDALSEDVTVEHHGDDVVVTARVRIDYKELGPSW